LGALIKVFQFGLWRHSKTAKRTKGTDQGEFLSRGGKKRRLPKKKNSADTAAGARGDAKPPPSPHHTLGKGDPKEGRKAAGWSNQLTKRGSQDWGSPLDLK